MFDHRDHGTPEEDWQDRLRTIATHDGPGPDDHVVVVAAHPDDETLGAGGLIAAASARGAHVDVVVATDGEASHPHSPTYSPTALAATRRAEVRRAVAALSPTAQVQFLGLPDGRLSCCAAKLSAALADALVDATLVVTPWREDHHPDHAACADVVASIAAVAHWQYPIWAWHWGDPSGGDLPWERMVRVDLTVEQRASKQEALSCHRSQHLPLSDAPGDEAILTAAMCDHFTRAFESFVVERAPASGGAYFDRLYARDDDPWGLADRFYEQRKRDLLLASLPRPRFRRAFEPGCATGELSVRLAERCDELVSWDGAIAAVRRAHERLGNNVSVRQRRIPDDWPDGEFDLVLLSEIGYYCTDLDRLASHVHRSLTADGVVVACHWRHPAPDHPHGAESVHDALGHGLHRIVQHAEADFLLDVWSGLPDSVATHEGIVG